MQTDLFAKNEAAAKERWEHLNKLVEMYKLDSALMKTARPR